MAEVPYDLHVFVCQNERPVGHPRGDCASKGSAAVHAALKSPVKAVCPDANIRVNKSGCLDVCEHGVAVVVYPSAVWYGGVRESDTGEIAASLIRGACPVERLEIRGAGE